MVAGRALGLRLKARALSRLPVTHLVESAATHGEAEHIILLASFGGLTSAHIPVWLMSTWPF
jgi:hypothetical protein